MLMRSASAGFLFFGLLLGLLCAAPGCSPSRHLLTEAEVERLASLRYPQDAERGPALDMLARREHRTLVLANFSPRTYHQMELWINRQYVKQADRLAIGPDNRFNITHAINLYREPYPVGGPLSPDKTVGLVVVELYDPIAKVLYPVPTEAD